MTKQKIKIHVDHLAFPDPEQFPYGFKENLIKYIDMAKNCPLENCDVPQEKEISQMA